jgi:CBS domain-containing protein
MCATSCGDHERMIATAGGSVLESLLIMRIEDIMSKTIWSVAPDARAELAWEQMRKRRVHHLVVMEGARVVGILSERDLGGARGERLRQDRRVSELMTPHVVVAAPETTLKKAANLLRGRVIGCLPVVDGKTLVGIVTTTDLLDLIGRGAERPVAESTRWVMKGRGPRVAGAARANKERRSPKRASYPGVRE